MTEIEIGMFIGRLDGIDRALKEVCQRQNEHAQRLRRLEFYTVAWITAAVLLGAGTKLSPVLAHLIGFAG